MFEHVPHTPLRNPIQSDPYLSNGLMRRTVIINLGLIFEALLQKRVPRGVACIVIFINSVSSGSAMLIVIDCVQCL